MNQASLHKYIASKYQNASSKKLFELRLSTNLTLIKDLFFSLYPEEKYSIFFDTLISKLPSLYKERPSELQQQDIERITDENWYQSEGLVGMQLYVDHFSDNLEGLRQRLDYFQKLGVNFLHLMPITPRPKGENDGGYAVNSYHEVDQRFGSKEDLLMLTDEMRSKGMYLMLDFVANHTSNEFSWAKKAMAGNLKYQNYYYTYPDRSVPDAFEKHLPEIFPVTSPGNFTFNHKMKRWVMTVFNEYQWDLNYSNPQVFIEMLSNLVKLVNNGVDVVRLDALAFMWKKIGTQSQNLPEVHMLISLFKLCLQVVAPGVVLLAEAIVAPKDIIRYFGNGKMSGNECEIAYNATLMALLWDAIATKKTILLYKNLRSLPKKPNESTWINYIRCHDDIGLGFEDHYIDEIGWDAKQHRKFLLDYYCQNIEWSPSKGQIFMYNPKTGDGRITGSSASLLGLEDALEKNDEQAIEEAIDKVIMLHGITMSYTGIPLIYAGDEIGMLNDYSYLNDENKKGDSRWVNRPFHDWKAITTLEVKNNYQSKIFFSLQHLIRIRKEHRAFADHNNVILYDNPNPHVFIYERNYPNSQGILVVCNFDHNAQIINLDTLGSYGLPEGIEDLISGKTLNITGHTVPLMPYEILWLKHIAN
ncbi:amylosucrase [Pareuzebyella sediminis]|uniref:amylosucrase n=1 Tax=Pareuzebyella sediminis TaxID=2607998 RepID=UPI0011EE2636|nr:amylosucrase [Pareuzebyella sediminis]